MSFGLKKNRKKRGHVSAGHGRVGKHRKHAAGRGAVGGLTHHRNLFVRYHPDHFGKKGKRNYHKKNNSDYKPFVNIEKIWGLIKTKTTSAIPANEIPVIDITEFGYHKLTGKGNLENRKCLVRARYFSKIAREKIEAVGGVCELV